MWNRGKLTAAVLGSLILHALLLFGLPRMQATTQSANRQAAPIQVTFIDAVREQAVSTPTAAAPEAAVQADAVPAAQPPAEQSAEAAAVQTPKPLQPAPKQSESARNAEAEPVRAAPSFRSGAELDPPPRPLGDIEPVYPLAAGLQQGTVVLRLMIDTQGEVEDVVVVSATPEGLFEASAIAAFGKARFSPGRYLGLPVRSQITIAVDYTPTDRGGAVSGQGANIGAQR